MAAYLCSVYYVVSAINLWMFRLAKVCRYRESAGGSRMHRHLKGVSYTTSAHNSFPEPFQRY